MEKYDLWFLAKKKNWELVFSGLVYNLALKELEIQTKVSVRHKLKATKFKIAKHRDTSWQKWL